MIHHDRQMLEESGRMPQQNAVMNQPRPLLIHHDAVLP
jgi:hypothetical protein